MIRFADLFAGIGGTRLALEQACTKLGIKTKCVFSSEIDSRACETYLLNFAEDPYCDIRVAQEFPDLDFLLAGFPCQPFSYAGNLQGFGDTRGTLFFEVERVLRERMPKAFLLENVRGLVSHDKGRTFKTIITTLENLGYGVRWLLLNSSKFGVPQNRVRLYIVGLLNETPMLTLTSDIGAADSHEYKKQHHQYSLFEDGDRRILVKDILEEYPDKRYRCSDKFIAQLSKVVGEDFNSLHGVRLIDYRGGNSIHSWELGIKGDCTPEEIEFMNSLIANRRRSKFGTNQDGKKLTIEQIRTFFDKPNLEQIIESLISKQYLQRDGGRYNPVCGNMSFEVFKFLDPDSISITLTASDANRLGVVQNNIPRRLTPRECARLQGFPDYFKLNADDASAYKQMGNTISVPVVEAVITDFLKK